MKLILITNDVDTAHCAELAGIDRIMVDLEIHGKDERQGHLDTVISRHQPDDISALRDVLRQAELMVRINPLHSGSCAEIEDLIARGAERLMLPMFRTPEEVARVIDMIAGRVPLTLLLETGAALARLPRIVEVAGIDDVHIGLNDLHLDLKLDFMFELFSSGLLDLVAETLQSAAIPFGIGGVAKLGGGRLPAKLILSEHRRLRSTRVILSRGFYSPATDRAEDLALEVARLRRHLSEHITDFETNRLALNAAVAEIVSEVVASRKM
jgi:hypothetical protein